MKYKAAYSANKEKKEREQKEREMLDPIFLTQSLLDLCIFQALQVNLVRVGGVVVR